MPYPFLGEMRKEVASSMDLLESLQCQPCGGDSGFSHSQSGTGTLLTPKLCPGTGFFEFRVRTQSLCMQQRGGGKPPLQMPCPPVGSSSGAHNLDTPLVGPRAGQPYGPVVCRAGGSPELQLPRLDMPSLCGSLFFCGWLVTPSQSQPKLPSGLVPKKS